MDDLTDGSEERPTGGSQSASGPRPSGEVAAPSAGNGYGAYAVEEISLLRYVNVLLRRWRIITATSFVFAFFAGVFSFVVAPTFTATAMFVPEVRSGSRVPSGLAGLATQFGISTGSNGVSPNFYAEVVKSREIIERVLLERYADPRGHNNPGDSATLLEILGVTGSDSVQRLYAGTAALTGLVSTQVDLQTGIVQLSVDARYPGLAAAVTNHLLEHLNEFNAKTRQSQARERRRFVEERVAEAERELGGAEEELKTFYEGNRSWQQSPHLVFEEGRLRRQVEIRQQIYLTLKGEYETARIEEVNDTPVITVIDPAVPPQGPSKPRRRRNVILAFVVGGMLGVFWAFSAENVDRMRRDGGEEYEEFRGLLHRFRGEVGGKLRTVARMRKDKDIDEGT